MTQGVHPAIATRGSTFVQNPGHPTLERIVTQTAIPLERRRIDTETSPEGLARQINELGDDMHAATLSARSLPFGGPVVVLEAVQFTNGQTFKLSHRLKTARVTWLLADVAVLTAGSPLAWRTAVDASTLSLHALGTFTADVILMVKP